MANWCSNYLTFSGENEDRALKLFEALAERGDREQRGVLPEFIEDPHRYMFDIGVDGGAVYFESKWAPPIEEIKQIGEHLDVDFELEYSEFGSSIYGKLIRINGQLYDIYLDPTDFDQYIYDKDNDIYVFRGENYGIEEEILEILLNEKTSML